jgi:hypothetical protein
MPKGPRSRKSVYHPSQPPPLHLPLGTLGLQYEPALRVVREPARRIVALTQLLLERAAPASAGGVALSAATAHGVAVALEVVGVALGA